MPGSNKQTPALLLLPLLAACCLAAASPLVGDVAPDFSATAVFKGDFMNITLAEHRGKYVVLLFYPLDFTFVCPTELIAFSERYDEFQKLNAVVLGISVDSQFTHLAW